MVSILPVENAATSTMYTRNLLAGAWVTLGLLSLACGGLVGPTEADDDDSAVEEAGDDDTTPADDFAGRELGFSWSGTLNIQSSSNDSPLSGTASIHYLAGDGSDCTHTWNFTGVLSAGLGQVPGCAFCEAVIAHGVHTPVSDPFSCDVLDEHDLAASGGLERLYGVRGLVGLTTAETYDPTLPDGSSLTDSLDALRRQGVNPTWLTVADLQPFFPFLAGDPQLGGLNFEAALVGGPTSPARPVGQLVWYGLWLGSFNRSASGSLRAAPTAPPVLVDAARIPGPLKLESLP